jgi:aryl-alcohol dehydrogenase-like predicted oxidoreductase
MGDGGVEAPRMTPRRLGAQGPMVSPIGFGAFKIGRNEGAKYGVAYELPSEGEAVALVQRVIDAGITLIDTAPAYGVSEQRVGLAIAGQRDRVILSTKAGERFVAGRSHYDFCDEAIEASVRHSLRTLAVGTIDILFLHSNGDDDAILADGGATRALRRLKDAGLIGTLGFSGKTVSGHLRAIDDGYDALMVEYHPLDRSQRPVLERAAERGVGIVIKKGLASGRVPASEAIPFALSAPAVASVVVGSLSVEHLAECIGLATSGSPLD